MDVQTTASSAAGVNNKLIEAWSDKVAGVHAFSSCLTTADVFGDGNYRLVVADDDRRLKVYKGHVRESDHLLADNPVAVVAFRGVNQREPQLAVAAGAHIYIYRRLAPVFKLAIPSAVADPQERAIWEDACAQGSAALDADAVLAQLRALALSGAALSARTRSALDAAAEAPAGAPPGAALGAWLRQPLQEPAFVTCLASIRVGQDDSQGPSVIVAGTERGGVLVLDGTGTAVAATHRVPGVPAMLACHGLLAASYKIFVALRDTNICVIAAGAVSDRRMRLESQPVAMAVAASWLAVACMASTLSFFDVHTLSRTSSVTLPAPPQALTVMERGRERLVAVALSTRVVLLYNGSSCVSRHSLPAQVMGLHAGPFTTEESALIAVLEGGTLDVRFLSRKAKLEAGRAEAAPDELTPLDVPKKTKLYIEFAKRERENAQALHHAFQRDLLKLRLRTAEAYVQVLTNGNGALGSVAGQKLRLQAALLGLGPLFRIVLKIQNGNTSALCHVHAALLYNRDMYSVDRPHFPIPLLIPGLQYTYEVDVTCLDPAAGVTDSVRVLLLERGKGVPMISATIALPLSEVEEE